MNIPAFVICRDLCTWTQRTVAGLEDGGVEEIYLVDNDSTYQPLLEFYETTPHTVLYLRANRGKRGPWNRGLIEGHASDRNFIVTDPDVVPHEDCPTDWLTHFSDILDRWPHIAKVGFGLPTDDLPASYEHAAMAQRRQAQHWREDRRCEVGFVTPLDTTLALYRAGTPYCTAPAIRTDWPYVARHLAWYIDSTNPGRELRHYRRRAHQRFGHWAKAVLPARVSSNPDRVLGGLKPKRR